MHPARVCRPVQIVCRVPIQSSRTQRSTLISAFSVARAPISRNRVKRRVLAAHKGFTMTAMRNRRAPRAPRYAPPCAVNFPYLLSLRIILAPLYISQYIYITFSESINQSTTLHQSQCICFLLQGTFVTATGAILCVDCAPGKSSTGALNGSLSCADCSAGRYSFGGSKCLPCEKGYVQMLDLTYIHKLLTLLSYHEPRMIIYSPVCLAHCRLISLQSDTTRPRARASAPFAPWADSQT